MGEALHPNSIYNIGSVSGNYERVSTKFSEMILLTKGLISNEEMFLPPLGVNLPPPSHNLK